MKTVPSANKDPKTRHTETRLANREKRSLIVVVLAWVGNLLRSNSRSKSEDGEQRDDIYPLF